MRSEIYPLLCESTEVGIKCLSADKVLKAQNCAEEAFDIAGKVDNLTVTGDALNKYFELFEGLKIANKELWVPSAESLITIALQQENNHGDILPVYTRLSDAEESERQKLADNSVKNLNTGVKDLPGDASQIIYQPMDVANLDEIANIEKQLMDTDA